MTKFSDVPNSGVISNVIENPHNIFGPEVERYFVHGLGPIYKISIVMAVDRLYDSAEGLGSTTLSWVYYQLVCRTTQYHLSSRISVSPWKGCGSCSEDSSRQVHH